MKPIPTPHLPAGTSVNQAQQGCPVAPCGQKRIAPDCERRYCCKHCIAEGGCISKTHTCSVTLASTQRPLSTQQSPSTQQPPRLHPITRSPTPPASTCPIHMSMPVGSSSITPTVLDANPNPQHASHMPAIFTEQIRCKQELTEAKRRTDGVRIACESKAK